MAIDNQRFNFNILGNRIMKIQLIPRLKGKIASLYKLEVDISEQVLWNTLSR